VRLLRKVFCDSSNRSASRDAFTSQEAMIAIPRLDERYARRFSPESFFEKSKRVGKVVGRETLEKAFSMYYAMRDADTPAWAKTAILAALGYFIVPLDAIVDVLPGAGYADDLGVLLFAMGTVAAHIKPIHVERAKQRLAAWFEGDQIEASKSIAKPKSAGEASAT
jgi:uncharacterized membrane protein YkvA (DUF1232 family)